MSKNLDGLSALNLSLDGRSIKSSGSNTSNNVNNNNNSANKKPPLTTNLGTNRTNHSNVSSVRDTYRFKRKTSIDRNVILKGREEEKKKQEENEIKQSNVFKPSSQQSSIDASVSENLSQRNYFQKEIPTETNKPATSDPLDLFFRDEPKTTNKHDSLDLNESREEKINKLKESTDSLRKELQLETLDLNASTNSSSNNNSADKNQAASKIQNWYRENQSRRDSDKEDEIKKLLQEKNTEMVKKMEKFNQMTLESSKKPKTYIIKKQIGKDKLLTPKKSVNKETSPVTSGRYQIEPIQVASQSQPQSQQTPAATNNNTKTNNSTSENNPTIESLLMELDKIDRESELILNSEAKSDNKTKLTSERGNSLLQFLDELDKKEVSTTPRAFKDLREFENDAISLLKAQSSRENKTTTTINSSRKSILKEDDVEKPTKPLKRESSSSKIKETLTFNTEKTKQQQPSNSEELLLKAKTVQNDLKTKISTQNAEIDEKNKIISKLEKDLSQQRELTLRHAQEADKEMQQRLQVQKNDYEATIQRHLNFIDQLIDDKKVLSEKCEKLVIELKDSEKRNSDKIRTLEEKFKVETHKSKEMLEAAEKLRREKWIEEKTKKIKEMTVKGLEPEIQALINKHKNEIKSMKAVHEAELMQADERAAQRYIKITEELRENYEREKEAAIQREREVSKQRYEKSLQDEEKSFLEQRRRLYAEIEEEKNRLAEVAAQQRKELDKQKRMLDENNFNAIEAIRKEYADNQKETEKKHQTEIQNLKEKLDIEKQSWEQNFLKKQENWMLQKERELKEQIKKERDKEIETLIARLETESTTSREEIERTAENRVKRIRDKYESELREVERTERETMERYNTVKAKYNEIEGEFERLKTVVKQKDRDLEGIKKLTDTLQEERNRLADVLRQEFADRIVFAEEENKRLKLDIAEMKSKHQFEQEKKREETEKLKRENAEELNKVHEKIKQVVTKKDEAYNQLKQQYDSACKRADHLEGLLEQQRALMLKKANDNNK